MDIVNRWGAMLFLGFFMGLIAGNARAQNIRKTQVLTIDPEVLTGKLSNGFTYYVRHNEEPKKRVIMYLVNKVGSLLEDEDQLGIAHFIEHMSFKGTKHYPKNALLDYLQKAGVRFGADINAYTGFDETVYQLPLPSDKPEVLQNGLQIMRDWAQEASLVPTEIEKERGVVLEEKRLGKGAAERFRNQYLPFLFNHSRYSTRIPIGTDSILNNFKPEIVRRFYRDWYRPDLQALIVVGDINVKQIIKLIEEKFSNLKKPLREKLRINYNIPLTGKNQYITIKDKEATSTSLKIFIKTNANIIKTTEDYRNSVIRSFFNQMLAARCADLTKQSDPPYLNGSARIERNDIPGLTAFEVMINTKPEQLERGFKAIWKELLRIKRFGFSQSELNRTKSNFHSLVETDWKERNKTNSVIYMQDYVRHFLKGEIPPGIEYENSYINEILPLVSLVEVNNLAHQYFTDINRDIIITAPEKEKVSLPDSVTINQWIKQVETEKITPYIDETTDKPLLGKLPKPGKIISENYNKNFQISTLMLNNGVKVILKSTIFKNEQILFSAFAPGGSSLHSDSDYQSAANAAGLIVASGVGDFNATLLSKVLTGKQVIVNPFINERFQGISCQSTAKDLETALQLTYLYFTSPRKDTAIFQGIISRSKTIIANRGNDPNTVFNDSISAILNNNNFRRTGPTLEKLSQVNLDKAYAIYKQRFADAANFTFTFVGNLDTAGIKPLLEKYLGSLPSTFNHEQAKDLGIHVPGGKINKTIYKGSESKATVQLVYSGPFTHSMENSAKLSALKEMLQLRLLERLREDEGGVYSPAVYASDSKFPQSHYTFTILFGCAPQNVEKLIASTLDEIIKLKTEGPPQVNIDKYKAETQRAREIALKTNNWWLSYLNSQLQNEEDLAQPNQYDSIMENITPASLREMATTYLSGDNFIRLVLLPQKIN